MAESHGQPNRPYLFGPYRVCPDSLEFSRDGVIVHLPTRKAFETLIALLDRAGTVVSKKDLIEVVWPGVFVSDDSLTKSIAMLRRALDDDPGQPEYIETVARRGYRFIAPVTRDASVVGAGAAMVVNPASADPSAAKRAGNVARWATVAAVTVALMGTASVALKPATPSPVLRLTHNAPAGTSFIGGGVLSPDGRQIAFIARSNETGIAQLWVRAFDARRARMIAGTERATRPFWSPDSRAIAFFADGKLRRVDFDREGEVTRPQTVITTVGYTPAGGSWGTSGEILFATRVSRVFVVSATGGVARPVTTINSDAGEVAHRWPQFLPDGRHFLYVAATSESDRAATYVASLDDASWRVRLLDDSSSPAFFAGPHYLLYVRERALMVQKVDLRSFRLDGTPIPISTDVNFPTLTNGGVVSSAAGLLAIWGGPADQQLTWYSRTGQLLGIVDAPTSLHNPVFSPDDRQLLAQGDSDRPGIWLVDLDRGAPMNLLAEGLAPVWGPHANHIAFSETTAAGRHIRVRALKAPDERPNDVRLDRTNTIVADWSTDGRYLLYSESGTASSRDVWVQSLDETRAAHPYLNSPANEVQSRISPDGRWVAYTSDESGTWQVYIQSFPTPGVKRVVSPSGGAEPQWRRDGRELFYVMPDGTMTAVDITLGADLRVGPPRALFRASIAGDLSSYRNRFAVTSDGERFLIDGAAEPYTPIEIIVNWTSLFRD